MRRAFACWVGALFSASRCLPQPHAAAMALKALPMMVPNSILSGAVLPMRSPIEDMSQELYRRRT